MKIRNTGLLKNKYTRKIITAGRIINQLRKSLRPKIETINIAITDKCNGKCLFCNIGRSYNDEDMAHMELIAGIITFFPDLKKVSITGGEPMLYNRIIDTYYMLNNRYSTNIITNGTLPDKVKNFTDVNSDARMSTSLHGIESMHDLCMGINGAWDKFHKTLSYIPGKIGCGMTICRANYDQIVDVYDHVSDLGLSFAVNVMDISELYYQNANLRDMLPTKEMKETIIEQMLQIKTNQPLWKKLQIELLKGKRRDFDCWSGRIQVFVHNSGRIYPCIYMDKAIQSLQLGHLSSHTQQINMSKCRKCLTHCEAMSSIVANPKFYIRETIRGGTLN